MFYNGRFFLPLALFVVSVVCLYNGLVAVRTRAATLPGLGGGEDTGLQGAAAVTAGAVLIAAAMLCLWVAVRMLLAA